LTLRSSHLLSRQYPSSKKLHYFLEFLLWSKFLHTKHFYIKIIVCKFALLLLLVGRHSSHSREPVFLREDARADAFCDQFVRNITQFLDPHALHALRLRPAKHLAMIGMNQAENAGSENDPTRGALTQSVKVIN
jgi:hypothetical protein